RTGGGADGPTRTDTGSNPVTTTQYPKEQMHRFAYTKLTERQIGDKLAAAAAGPKSASPLSQALAGTTLTIVTDSGPTLSYQFTSGNELSVAENGGKRVATGFGALVLDRAALFSHL